MFPALFMTSMVFVVGVSVAPSAEAKRASGSFNQSARTPVGQVNKPVVAPKPLPSYVGGATPAVAFNRHAIGGGSGVNAELRARAYRAIDANMAKTGTHTGPYANRGPHLLPNKTADGREIQYTEIRLRDGPHKSTYSNGRVVVGNSPQGPLSGRAYVSRHYGDPVPGSSTPGAVVRIQ
jgi:hypothetical protein